MTRKCVCVICGESGAYMKGAWCEPCIVAIADADEFQEFTRTMVANWAANRARSYERKRARAKGGAR
jgi:hypothetical protein